jgi:hypothetical protein
MQFAVRAGPVDRAGVVHRVAGPECIDVGADRLDDPGCVPAEDLGSAGGRRHSGADLHVYWIDRNCLYPNQEVAGLWLGRTQFQIDE